MFSLRVAILLVLSTTQFDGYAVCGYSVDIPLTVTVDEPSEESNILLETTSPCPPETTNNPVIENPTVPTLEIGDSSNAVASTQFALLQQNFNISGPGRKGKRKSCICKECNPETGFFIKHFRQYNYYYPHHKITVPMQYIDSYSSEEPINNFPDFSSIFMRNDKAAFNPKRSSKTTVRYNKPSGIDSYVPNDDNNYIYNQLGSEIRQSAPVNSRSIVFDQRSMGNEEPASSDESAEPIPEPNEDDDDTDTVNHSDDNINEDIIHYFSEPDVFGHNRRTVIKNANRHFQSQQVSISSRTQSQSQPQLSTGIEPQQVGVSSQSIETQQKQDRNRIDMNKIDIQTQTMPSSESEQQERTSSSTQSQSLSGFGLQQQGRINVDKIDIKTQTLPGSQSQQQYIVSSSSQSQRHGEIDMNEMQTLPNSASQEQNVISSNMQSCSLPNLGPSINLASNANFDNQNRMTVSYNPYFQSQIFGMSPMMQLQSPLSTSSYKNSMDWLGASTAKQQHINHPKSPCERCNPVRTWSSSPRLYDLSNMSPAYSVII